MTNPIATPVRKVWCWADASGASLVAWSIIDANDELVIDLNHISIEDADEEEAFAEYVVLAINRSELFDDCVEALRKIEDEADAGIETGNEATSLRVVFVNTRALLERIDQERGD